MKPRKYDSCLTLKVTPEMAARLRARAEEDGRSVGGVLREATKFYFEYLDQKGDQ